MATFIWRHLTLRLRIRNLGQLEELFHSSNAPPVLPLPASKDVLAAADLTPTLPTDIPLQVMRTWALESANSSCGFRLKNKSSESVQIGALGIPMIFNNVLNDRSLEEAHAKCSFYDPYIGEDAGIFASHAPQRAWAGAAGRP